ncbi:UNVERIFIED_CONTAM: hypothetical protein GTU68_052054 [Idotea baltica]|nr:hypothetical protein [Idotea baltica]
MSISSLPLHQMEEISYFSLILKVVKP